MLFILLAVLVSLVSALPITEKQDDSQPDDDGHARLKRITRAFRDIRAARNLVQKLKDIAVAAEAERNQYMDTSQSSTQSMLKQVKDGKKGHHEDHCTGHDEDDHDEHHRGEDHDSHCNKHDHDHDHDEKGKKLDDSQPDDGHIRLKRIMRAFRDIRLTRNLMQKLQDLKK